MKNLATAVPSIGGGSHLKTALTDGQTEGDISIYRKRTMYHHMNHLMNTYRPFVSDMTDWDCLNYFAIGTLGCYMIWEPCVLFLGEPNCFFE